MCGNSLSFIIIEYNCLEDIKVCINSIQSLEMDIFYEIIVSSNSLYSLEMQARLKHDSPEICWNFNDGNLGFAGGMNAGIAKAKGDIIVVLNPDVEITDGGLKKAFDYMVGNPRVGLLGPRIVDSSGKLQDSCRHFLSPIILFKRILKRMVHKQDVLIEPFFDYSKVQAVDWVIGAFMMVRKDSLNVVGGFDEGFFLYVEDMDLCKRFWNNNYEVVYFPELLIKYKGDRKSTSPLFSRKIMNRYSFYHVKSYLRFILKHGLNPKRTAKSK